MTTRIIDFSTYSSLKIGTPLSVYMINMGDINANNTHNTSKSPVLLSNYTLTCNKLIESNQSFLRIDDRELLIIGSANNLLVSPNAKNLAILDNSFNYISNNDSLIEMGASVSALNAFLYFKKHDYQGLEFLKNLPGVIGALCNMNAGMKEYEIGNILHSLNINGEWIDSKNARLHYRGRESSGVIFAARFHKIKGFRADLLPIFSAMRKSHPHDPSCGSCFKNPKGDFAGRLLESSALKGFSINGAAFSDKHANFLINKGNARFEDAIRLINLAKEKVYKDHNIMLECEVKICE